MGRIGYLDCFSGVSGDMLLGALVDAGVPLEEMRAELAKLPLAGYSLEAGQVTKGGLAAVQAVVRRAAEERPAPRSPADVTDVIDRSSLPLTDREKGIAVFRRLAEAEAAVHGETIETVHLHDVGAVDTIVDVMGSIAGLRLLDVEELYCSSLPSGEGRVEGRHGTLPLPAPATLELLARAGAPLRASGEGELVTPTGAAIVTTLARFERPEMTLERVGYGAGSRDLHDRPNVLRLWLGQGATEGTQPKVLLETNVDDMTGEMLGYVLEKLLAGGAADAWLTPVQMKKGRPGVVLSVICAEAREEALARLLLRETSTLGVRVRPVHRWEAERVVVEFESSLGPAAVKVKRLPDEPPRPDGRPSGRVAPEYEVCKRLAESSGLPLAEVYRIVQAEGEARLAERESQEPTT